MQDCQIIFCGTRCGILRYKAQGTSNLILWINFMSQQHSFCTGKQDIQTSSRQPLRRIFHFIKIQTASQFRIDLVIIIIIIKYSMIYFIKGKPVLHFSFEFCKQCFCHLQINVNHILTHPGIVFTNKMNRHFCMQNRHQRLNIIFQKLINHIVIESQTLRIWRLFLTCWIYSRPVHRQAIALQA